MRAGWAAWEDMPVSDGPEDDRPRFGLPVIPAGERERLAQLRRDVPRPVALAAMAEQLRESGARYERLTRVSLAPHLQRFFSPEFAAVTRRVLERVLEAVA